MRKLISHSDRLRVLALTVVLVFAGVALTGVAVADAGASGPTVTDVELDDDPSASSLDIEDTERTVGESTVAPGGSTTVTVSVNTTGDLDAGELFEIEEQFSPAFDDVELVNMDPGGTAGPGPDNEELLAIWSVGNGTYTLSYEVTLPSDAAVGDTFDIGGTIQTGGQEVALPDATITAGFPEETSVALEPSEATAEPEGQTAFDVVVTGADEGIGSYAVNVSVGNTTVGSISAVEHAVSPETDNNTVAGDGSWGLLAGDLGGNAHDADPRIVIGQIIVEAGARGETDLPVDAAEVADSTGTAYDVAATEGATLTVEELSPFDFEVEVQQDAQVQQDEDVSVNASVTNLAEEPSSGTVELVVDIDGDGTFDDTEVVASEFAEFDAGEIREIVLNYQDVQLQPGSYDYVARIVRNDQEVRSFTEGTLTVEEPPPFDFEVEVQQDAEVEQGGDVGVSAFVTNLAEEPSSGTVELVVDADDNDEFEDTEIVVSEFAEFDAGETREIVLDYQDVQLEFGSYDYVARIVRNDQETRSFTEGTLTVAEDVGPPPVVGDTPPNDLNGDGLYRDIDGNGEFDIFDIQSLFTNLDSDAVQNNPEAFNFAGNENPEEVTIFDVQALFTDLQEGVV